MGRDKSQLVLGTETMLARQIRLLGSVCRSVAALGPSSKFPRLGVPVFADEVSGRGPLGGIYTALLHSRTEFNLVVSCDLPFLGIRFLRYLCLQALEGEADVTVPESARRGLEPLCAIYRRRALAVVRRSLELGETKVTRFFPRVRCHVLRWQELGRAGFTPRIFANMNTPEEYEAARRTFGDVTALARVL